MSCFRPPSVLPYFPSAFFTELWNLLSLQKRLIIRWNSPNQLYPVLTVLHICFIFFIFSIASEAVWNVDFQLYKGAQDAFPRDGTNLHLYSFSCQYVITVGTARLFHYCQSDRYDMVPLCFNYVSYNIWELHSILLFIGPWVSRFIWPVFSFPPSPVHW